MVRSGKVVGKKKDVLEVCFKRSAMCEHCGQCTGKAHEEVFKVFGQAEIGDFVDVKMPETKILKVSLIVYLVPLVCFLLGLLLGNAIFHSDAYTALFGVLFLALSLVSLHFYDKKTDIRNKYMPQIVQVYHNQKGDNENE